MLDFSTVTFIAGGANALAGVTILLLAFSHRDHTALWYFAAGAFVSAAGLWLFWGMAPPRPVLPRTVANLAVIEGHLLPLLGFLIFYDRRAAPWAMHGLILGGAAAAFGAVWLLGDAFGPRLWTYSLFAAGLSAAIAVLLLGPRPDRKRFERWPGERILVGAAFAVHAAITLGRATVGGEAAATFDMAGVPAMYVNTLSMLDAVVLAFLLAWGVTALHDQKLTRSLDRIARRDPLTRLPNRLALEELFELLRSDGRGFAVGLIDLDDFKRINDELGHEVGDRVLEAVTRRLSDDLRPDDTLVRLGGDEFLALLPDADYASGAGALSRLLDQLASEPVATRESKLTVRASGGVSVFPRDGTDFQTLYRVADQRLYDAKAAVKAGASDAAPAD